MLPQVIANGIVAGGSYVLVAVGFSLISRVFRFFHVAHGISFSAAAYTAYVCDRHAGLFLPVSVLLGVMVAVAMGLGLTALIYRPLLRRGATPLMFFLGSLGALVFLQNLIALVFGDGTISFRRIELSQSMILFGTYVTPVQLLQLGSGVGLTLFLIAWLQLTPAGQRAQAYGDDPELAEIRGVSAWRVHLTCMGTGSAFAGLGGVLSGMDTDLTPTMGFNPMLTSIVAMILAGDRNLLGTMLSAFVIGALRHLAGWLMPTQWQDTVTFLLLAACLLLRPHGVLGRRPPQTAA